MSELRKKLAGKTRRRITVSVAISDAAEAVARANRAEREHIMATARKETDEKLAELQFELDAAREAVRSHFVDVEFQACAPADFEALQTDFTSKDGGIDPEKMSANLPALIAVCAVDEDLRDEAFWGEQLQSGSWSFGERIGLGNRLLNLNLATPDERIPFA